MEKTIYFIGPTLAMRKNYGGATIKNQYLLDYLKDKKIKVKIIDTDNWRKRFLVILFKILLIFLMPNKNNIILSTSSGGTYIFLKINYYLNIFRKKIIYFVIGGDTPLKLESNKYNKKYYEKIERIYIETKSMKKIMINLGLKQTEYLPNFKKFNLRKYKKRTIELPLKCLFFSRITPEKGVDIIFETLDKIDKNILTLDFYGPIDEKYKENFFKKINNFKNINYKGIVNTLDEKIYDTIENYDLMLFPTYWSGEGFPGVLVDSLIAGVPILASNCNYNEEIVENKKTGLIFKSKDNDDFKEKLEFLLKNLNMLEQMRKECYLESKKYQANSLLKNLSF